jgi:Zn-dependent protease
MLGKQVRLFRLMGFDVRVHASWLIIAALVTWSFATQVFGMKQCFNPAVCWTLGVLGTVGLFMSVVLHEMCHSLVARKYGLPMKGITLFIFGGVAELDEEPPSPKVEFLMAIAGPVSSVVLGGVFYGAAWLVGAIRATPEVEGLLGLLGMINLVLAAFNMIPGFPLDGGRVLRSALWAWKGRRPKPPGALGDPSLRWATRIASEAGSAFGFVLIAWGILDVLMGAPVQGLWMFLIGLFIRFAAKQGYQQVLVRGLLVGEPIRRLMNPNVVTVEAALPLKSFVEDFVYKYHYKVFPVLRDSGVTGVATTRRLRDVPQEQWGATTVANIMEPCSPSNTLSPDADAMAALAVMNRTDTETLVVVEAGRLVGVLTMKDLMKFMTLKLELESEHVDQSLHLPNGS